MRSDLRRVEHAVARILAETERPVEVYEATLEAIGRPIGWPLGAVWELDPEDGSPALRANLARRRARGRVPGAQ